jgi:hypothetical protein
MRLVPHGKRFKGEALFTPRTYHIAEAPIVGGLGNDAIRGQVWWDTGIAHEYAAFPDGR